jgi:alkanesulfonate monooxygenase SsuD/methylene tetrahydromethanopterin reductase-like flavin-dependent oxidoreductase (luciferase family)
MWSDDDGPFDGHHYQLAETICSPRPVQRPAPPVMIGGTGERKTLRLVAEYADACNLFAVGPAEVAHKLDVLRDHCAAVGRDPAEIEKTIIWSAGNALDGPDAFIRDMAGYAALGIDMVCLAPVGPDPAAWTSEMVEHVLPRLRELG